ncbi:MAG: AzlD domain-containing protein [Anaerolineales bacterium]|jgi:branched-subunit amino acid transport protein
MMSYERLDYWAIIIGGMLVTYLTRISFFFLDPDRLPEKVRRSLRLVPTAVLAAIITPAWIGEISSFSWEQPQFLAGCVAAITAWWTKNTWLTIVVGFAALFLFTTVLS